MSAQFATHYCLFIFSFVYASNIEWYLKIPARKLWTSDNNISPVKLIRDEIKLHRCIDAGEVYSAAYLITKELLLIQDVGHNLSHVNCEMASFIIFHKNILIQSLDVLEFSIVHLSAYERLQKRYFHKFKIKELKSGNLDAIVNTTVILKNQTMHNNRHISIQEKFNRTVVIMPFLASEMGAGHSNIENRLIYLRACFWSVYKYFPKVVVVVRSPYDRDIVQVIRREGKLRKEEGNGMEGTRKWTNIIILSTL